MSKQSEAVKRWRKSCKERIVESMGGECCLCGYKKCTSSLSLHHLDPTKKDFGIGAIRANPKNWSSIVQELRKCILVCNNCHGEIHAGLTSVPKLVTQFNECFADYQETSKLMELEPCPICSKPKPKYLRNCSLACASKSRYVVNWEIINLENEIKNKTIVRIAEELGCSDGAVHKRLRKLGLK